MQISKRALIAALNVPALALPIVFGATVAQPLAGPSLHAMQTTECRRKAVFSEGKMHCHEEGSNCVIECPDQT